MPQSAITDRRERQQRQIQPQSHLAHNINGKELNAAVYEAQAQNKLQEIINLTKENQVEDDWKKVHYKKSSKYANQRGEDNILPTKKRNTTTFGSNTQSLAITAIESRRHIFISRLSPSTTIDQLKAHLNNNNIQLMDLEKIQTKSTDIAVFKLQVPFSEVGRVFDPTIWPKYTILRPYREPKPSGRNFTTPAQVAGQRF